MRIIMLCVFLTGWLLLSHNISRQSDEYKARYESLPAYREALVTNERLDQCIANLAILMVMLFLLERLSHMK